MYQGPISLQLPSKTSIGQAYKEIRLVMTKSMVFQAVREVSMACTARGRTVLLGRMVSFKEKRIPHPLS